MGDIRDVLGLLNTGKRVYQQVDGEVDREEMDYMVLLDTLVFGDRGLVDTLGSTWNLVHDPRFEAIENCFIINKKSVFGGDARQGVQTQLPDGTLTSGTNDLEQYSEILGEGRYFLSIVLGRGYADAIKKLWPKRKFWSSPIASEKGPKRQEIYDGLKQFAQLTAEEQLLVSSALAAAEADGTVYPGPDAVRLWPDDQLWDLIKQESPGYFYKNGEPNEKAETLYKLFRADLIGLVYDYAEIANIQEWVLLDDKGTLCTDEQREDDEVNQVWFEVDILERALTFRAQLRITAAKILKLIGFAQMVENQGIQLTDLERDNLLRIVYSSNWPDDRPELVSRLTGYLAYVKSQGAFEERQTAQFGAARASSRAFVAGVKDGSIQPITRYTEPVFDVPENENEKIMGRILNDPLFGDLFFRFTAAERTIRDLEQPDGENGDEYPAESEETSILSEGDTKRLGHAQFVVDLLTPLFSSSDSVLDEDKYTYLLKQIFATSPEYAQIEVEGSEGALQSVPL